MKIVERNGLRILYPKYGYMLRNVKTNDIHMGKIYLGVNSSPEDFEEIRDENINELLLDTIDEVEQKETSLMKIGKIVANEVTDDAVALEIQEFYDIWKSGVTYEVGRYITYNNILYKVLTVHTSQDDWTPDVSPSLFANVLTSLDGTPQEWVKPDSTNAYMTGDKVIFEGVIYESTIDNNIWSPAEYPAGWKLIEE